MSASEHPARFSKAILQLLGTTIRDFGLPVHDPFAGDGIRLGALCDQLQVRFSGGDIEDWPRHDRRVRLLDATLASAYPEGDVVIVTSPVYPNGMADHFTPRDGSKRYTYRTALGRDLAPNNAGRFSVRGGRARAEGRYWLIQERAVRHWRGPVVVNVSDFIFAGDVYPLVDKWFDLLWKHGFAVGRHFVATPRMKNGANRDLRVGREAVLVGVPRPVPTDEEANRGRSGRLSERDPSTQHTPVGNFVLHHGTFTNTWSGYEPSGNRYTFGVESFPAPTDDP